MLLMKDGKDSDEPPPPAAAATMTATAAAPYSSCEAILGVNNWL